MKAQKAKEHRAATRLQAAARGWQVRTRMKSQKDMEHRAATRLQAAARGWQVRTHMKAQKVKDEEHRAATRLQAAGRGWQLRTQLKAQKEVAGHLPPGTAAMLERGRRYLLDDGSIPTSVVEVALNHLQSELLRTCVRKHE